MMHSSLWSITSKANTGPCTLQIAEVDSNGFMKDTYFVFQRVRTVSESALKLNRNVLRSKSFWRLATILLDACDMNSSHGPERGGVCCLKLSCLKSSCSSTLQYDATSKSRVRRAGLPINVTASEIIFIAFLVIIHGKATPSILPLH